MLKSKSLEISKQIPLEISSINTIVENINYSFVISPFAERSWAKLPDIKQAIKPVNPWADSPVDSKKIISILNKISEENYDKMVEEANTFNYTDPKIVNIMFKKIIAEPFFSDLYARLCNDLVHLHPIIRNMCADEFSNNKHKNLGKFISELYKLKIIKSLDVFIKVLTNDLTEYNLEILCKIIITTGVKEPQFKKIITNLNEIKLTFSSRFKFMIMDVVDKFKE